MEAAVPASGEMVNSEFLTGTPGNVAFDRTIEYIEEKGIGKRAVNYPHRSRSSIALRADRWQFRMMIYRFYYQKMWNGCPRVRARSSCIRPGALLSAQSAAGRQNARQIPWIRLCVPAGITCVT